MSRAVHDFADGCGYGADVVRFVENSLCAVCAFAADAG